MAKKLGKGNDNATKANVMPVTSWVATTKCFLVLNISSSGLHNGFKVQGSIINEVQNAICESEIPRFLNINEDAAAIATNGNPMAK